MTDTAPSLGQDKHSSHGESSRQNRKSAPLRPPHTGKGHHFLAMRLGFASPASTHKGKPLSDIFEAPPGTASAHGKPFLRIFPAHPAVGVTSYPENPSQGATPNTGHWQPPRMQKITPIYSRFLRPPPHTENPFYTSSRLTLQRVQSRPRSPLSECHTKCRPLELPHTRGKAASVCAGRR